MSYKKLLIGIIASLLLFNVIGTVMILLQINEADKETATALATDPSKPADSINSIETIPERKSALPAKFSPHIEPVVEISTDPEKSPEDQGATEIIIARVNKTDIGQSLLISYLKQLATPENFAQWNTLNEIPQSILMQSINNAVLDILLVQLAIEMKIDRYPDIQADIAQSNRNILKSAFLNQLAPELVNNADIATQYQTLLASLEGKFEYRARHILLANQKEARIVEKALEQKKKSFDELAKLFSLDEPTALRGGDLGYVLAGQLNPEFENVINNLEIGQQSKPFETELGWHIAIVDDRRNSQPMTLTQATPIIRQKLERQAIQKYLTDLLASATIEVLIAPDTATENLSAIDTAPVE